MNLNDIIRINDDFQTSVNVAFDFGSSKKVEALIATDSVCKYVEELLSDVMQPSHSRAKLFVGPYGKGKSHITLVALTAMWNKDLSLMAKIAAAYGEKGLPFQESFCEFVENGPKILPVIIEGGSSNLKRSLLFALRTALRREGLEELMPTTSYSAAEKVIARWRSHYPDTLKRLERELGLGAGAIESRLRNMDEPVYEAFVAAYPSLTSGGTFDVLESADALRVYEDVLCKLKDRGVSGIYVVYDEFSKYLESNISTASGEDIKLLQDFAEKCNRSEHASQLHLLLISHKSLENYIDKKLPKDKVDGWRGVSGRFREVEVVSGPDQAYELIEHAVQKTDRLGQWLNEDDCRRKTVIASARRRYVLSGLVSEEDSARLVDGCLPLHPVSAFLLPRVSERVAQNERTLFTFLCSREDNSLSRIANAQNELVSPDAIYDYFEPLFKKELYSSPMHKVYELARASLLHVAKDSLEAKLVKTISLLNAVAQYDVLPPTRPVVSEVFVDCGYSQNVVADAIAKLTEGSSIAYLRQSDSHIRLKESSGVRVDAEVANRAELLKATQSVTSILNDNLLAKALYPSAYNEEHSIVRYFDCGFASWSDIVDVDFGRRVVDGHGDGFVVAILPQSSSDMAKLEEVARTYTEKNPLCMAVIPRKFEDVEQTLFLQRAAQLLKEEASDNEVLAEECEIMLQDYSEVVDRFVDGFFRPELGKARYFSSGRRRNGVTRKRRLSSLLSELCEASFPFTPRITSEALNKNELTGTAFHSRGRVLKSLISTRIEPNLGFVGNGQELSMARSALSQTGVIEDFEEQPVINYAPAGNECISLTIKTIDSFASRADGSSASILIDSLREPYNEADCCGGIGMKKGPIPLFLAVVFLRYRDELVFESEGKERQLSADLLEDLVARPAKYTITRLNWSAEKASYLTGLGELFGCPEGCGRSDVIEAIRRWYVSLPQVTRNATANHSPSTECGVSFSQRKKFLKAVKRVDVDSNKLLFDFIPQALGLPADDPALIGLVTEAKKACDKDVSRIKFDLAESIKRVFDCEAHADASLSSVLKDWLEGLPQPTDNLVLTTLATACVNVAKVATADDCETASKLARAATSLRLEDWGDDRFAEFVSLLGAVKEEIERKAKIVESEEFDSGNEISYIDAGGVKRTKAFQSTECSGRAGLLKNSILSCLDEMGAAVSEDEKRQVVFEILKGLC